MSRQKSWKGKGTYAVYKAANRGLSNKIKKLARHCIAFPNDIVGRDNLERIKKNGCKLRAKPLAPRKERTEPKIKFLGEVVLGPDTPGEQLSKLLGIPMPIVRRRKKHKTVIKHKPRRK